MKPVLIILLLLTLACNNYKWVCLGDSLTAGYGIDKKSTFPNLLQKQLSHLKVYNFGTLGLTSNSALLSLKK